MAPGPLWDVSPDQQASEVWVAPEVASADVAFPAVALSWPHGESVPLPSHQRCLDVVVLVRGCACPAVAVGVQLCPPAVPAAAVALPLQLCCAGSGCCAQSSGAFLDYSPII